MVYSIVGNYLRPVKVEAKDLAACQSFSTLFRSPYTFLLSISLSLFFFSFLCTPFLAWAGSEGKFGISARLNVRSSVRRDHNVRLCVHFSPSLLSHPHSLTNVKSTFYYLPRGENRIEILLLHLNLLRFSLPLAFPDVDLTKVYGGVSSTGYEIEESQDSE